LRALTSRGVLIADQPTTRLTLVRHGESVVTVDQVVGGPETCSGLSPLGFDQAACLRDRYRAGHEPAIDALWVSTMPRARQTADALNEALGLDVNVDVELEERRPGDADGVRWADYSERFGDFRLLDNPYRPLAPNGESQAQFDLRIGQALDRVIAAHRGTSVVVVCHAGVIDVAFRQLLRLRPTGGFWLSTKNTSLTEFVTDDDGARPVWRLVRYNDAAHLSGLPDKTEPAGA